MAPTPVVDHLSNPLVTPNQLSISSMALEGIPPDLETSVLFVGKQLIHAAGILLRLPQDIIAKAIVIFTRYWVGSGSDNLDKSDVGVNVCLRTQSSSVVSPSDAKSHANIL